MFKRAQVVALLAVSLLWVGAAEACKPAIAPGKVFVELGAGYDTHLDQGTNPRAVIRARGYVTRNWLLEFNHHSSVKDGWPFNRKPEDLTNQWSVIYSIPLN